MAGTIKTRVDKDYKDVLLSELRKSFDIPADRFAGGCDCRPIIVEKMLFLAGEDDCPVHGFLREEEGE